MQGRFIRIAGTAFAAAALVAMAPPSDPVGVYAVIDRVVVAPDTTNPTTIQIWGTFAVSKKEPGDKYHPAAKGYLYYRLNANNTTASRAEWGDLRRLAGTKTIVGFAAKWNSLPPGHVRCATDVPANADEYPTQNGMGVVRMPEQRNTGWPIAKDLLSAKVPDAPCGKAK